MSRISSSFSAHILASRPVHASRPGSTSFTRAKLSTIRISGSGDETGLPRLMPHGEETPWREVRPDDFVHTKWTPTRHAQKALIAERDAGGYRLRVVLREARDLRYQCRGTDDPLFVHNYRYQQGYILHHADEVVIELCDGRRYCVNRTTTPWTTEPIDEATAEVLDKAG